MQVHRSQPRIHFYSSCGHMLSLVEEAKYLGVLLTNNLSWSPHVASTAAKTSPALGFLKRNLKKCPAVLQEHACMCLLYSGLCQSHMRSAPEKTRTYPLSRGLNFRAAPYDTCNYYCLSSVSSNMQPLGLYTLEDWRREVGLTWFYKQRVLMHGHQGWNVQHGLYHIYMIYVYIWVVYSFCLFCCLFIIVTTQFVALYKPCKPKPKPST